MSEITTKIDSTIEKYNMLNSGDYVVVGVSGGADSMLLLSYLAAKRDSLNLKITVANVEHGIRGNSSLDDTELVRQYCLDNGIDFKTISINAPLEAKKAGLGVEEYSRNRRYEFFNSFGADKIATAHSLSDNIETVLFRLSRGTGLKGFCGIPPVRDNIIRPLINCTSEEIRQECREMGIPFCVDETNFDNAYSRNYIRNVIVPEFKKLNPSFENAVMRFVMSSAEDEEFIESAVLSSYSKCAENGKLNLSFLRTLPLAIAKRILTKLLAENGIKTDELHLNGAAALINKAGKYQIKNNIFLVSDEKFIRLAVFDDEPKALKYEEKVVDIDNFLTNCELLKKEFAFFCDYDKIVGSAFVRCRQEGDTVSPSGRGCTKTLKKLFNEYKIPIEKRNNFPVIADDIGVIGVYDTTVDERVKIDGGTKAVYMLKVTEDKS